MACYIMLRFFFCTHNTTTPRSWDIRIFYIILHPILSLHPNHVEAKLVYKWHRIQILTSSPAIKLRNHGHFHGKYLSTISENPEPPNIKIGFSFKIKPFKKVQNLELVQGEWRQENPLFYAWETVVIPVEMLPPSTICWQNRQAIKHRLSQFIFGLEHQFFLSFPELWYSFMFFHRKLLTGADRRQWMAFFRVAGIITSNYDDNYHPLTNNH